MYVGYTFYILLSLFTQGYIKDSDVQSRPVPAPVPAPVTFRALRALTRRD